MNEAELFADALEVADLAERSVFVRQACGGDDALRQRVERLLALHESDHRFLEVTAAQPADLTATMWQAPGDTAQSGVLPVELSHFDVVGTIGRGGMGIVLKGFDRKLKRDVAIKVLNPALAANAEAVQRFLREAQSAAAVRHENVVTIYSVDDHSQSPFLVMEFIDGESLQDRITRDGPVPPRDAAEIARQIALGLAAAHAKGLVHRDVKPGNILLEGVRGWELGVGETTPYRDRQGAADGQPPTATDRSLTVAVQNPNPQPLTPNPYRVKITDFGLARAVDDLGITQSGMIAGTPQFMSPEQADAKAVDHRTDLFSLGGVLQVMLTGRPPFNAPSTLALLRQIVESEARPIPSEIVAPEWLLRIIDKLLAKNPTNRFQTATEVAELLGRHLRGDESVANRAVISRVGSWSVPRRSTWLVVAGVAVLIAAGLWLSFGRGTRETQVEPIRVTTGSTHELTGSVTRPVPEVSSVRTHESPHPLLSDKYRWLEPVRLGTEVNTPESDECPCISSDGLTLIFNRLVQGKQWLWESRRADISQAFCPAVPIPGDINQPASDNDCPFVSRDGLTLWFASNRPGGHGQRDLWMSHRKSPAGVWETPTNLGLNINSADFEQTPFVTSNGLTLFFSRNVSGHFRFYQATRTNADEAFGNVRFLANVNDGECSSFPRLTDDGLLLIFTHSETRGENLGLWFSTRNSVDEEFSPPTKLTPLINDAVVSGQSFSADERTLYYASQRDTGTDKYDIWSITRVPK